MKDAIVIKSFSDGLNLIMRDDIPFDQIMEEAIQKFKDGRSFFGNATMAISVEGRSLSQEDEIRLLDVIREYTDMKVFCIVGKESEENKSYVRAVKQLEQTIRDKDMGEFYNGSLKDGQVIETTNTIVIIGDVNPGCAVISNKNIIVLGGLYGEAFAGEENKNNHFVLALEMEPERLRIGDYKYKIQKKSKWGIRQKIQPKVAYVKDDEIVMDVPTRDIMRFF